MATQVLTTQANSSQEDVTSQHKKRHLPAEVGIWTFIFGDLIVFALFFLIVLYYKGLNQALFHQSQAHLNQFYAMFNTLLLLTSSWFVARGVQAAQKGLAKTASTQFALTILCGVGFATVKYLEYGEKLRAGFTLKTNDFFTCYYMFTGTHLAHVVLGMFMLFLMIRTLRSGTIDARKIRFVEAGAIFWHMVDLLWIVLFALFYLVK